MGAKLPRALTIVGFSTLMLGASYVGARKPHPLPFDLPSQPLAASLHAIAARARVTIAAPADLLDGRTAPALAGEMTIDQAVGRLLRGSGLHARNVGGAIVIKADETGSPSVALDQEVLITGSRIRGAAVASPLITTSRDQIRDSGRTDLGQVIREIPQNFAGGQNPGVALTVPQASGANVGGGSALNLRGLGSDATLTLLNGHRLAYTAVFQSVDISAIPIAILDRIEIVPDGASALYGSDAVAGVANVILKRDFSGLELDASLGKATAGGDFEQRYGAMAGRSWSSGGVVGALEHGRSTAIQSEQRSYADDIPGLSLFPSLRHDSAVIAGHQALGSQLTLTVDGLYNARRSDTSYPIVPPAYVGNYHTNDRSVAVAPELVWSGGPWQAHLGATYGWEKVNYVQTGCKSGICSLSGSGYYANQAKSAEAGADGTLFTWAGGPAKLAFGGGYRDIHFERFNGPTAANLNTRHRQDSYFAYGELSLPLVGPDNRMPFLHRASASGALRYERYPGIGQIVRPKIGLIVGPTVDFDVKLSWGKSFRAPTLYEQYQPRSIYLYPPSWVGGVEGGGAATLVALGGNRALKPERATTFSATFDLHPRDSRFDLAATYYRVAYRDRIVAPLRFLSNALTDPTYADQVTLHPTADQIAATIASGATFLNYTTGAYDPKKVVAIIDDGNVNAGRVDVRGMDLLVSYVLPVGRDQVILNGDIGYIDSTQRLTPDAPLQGLAGTVFSPPHWRGRGTASWRTGALTLTADLNYTGSERDTRGARAVAVGAMTTAGLTARWQVPSTFLWLKGLDLSASVQNLFDAKPPLIVRRSTQDAPFDSTNVSATGRFLSFAVRKTW